MKKYISLTSLILNIIVITHLNLNSNQDSSDFIDYNNDVLLYDSIVYRFNHADSIINFNSSKEECKELKIDPVVNNKYKMYIRLGLGYSFINIWQDDEGLLNGTMIHWVTEIDCESRSRIRKYSVSYKLNQNSINEIYDFVMESKVLNIPDQSRIFSWMQGEYGVTYTIESNVDSTYKYQSYWSPSAQKNVRAALEIEKFVSKVKQLSDYGESIKTFYNGLPFDCFVRGMIVTVPSK